MKSFTYRGAARTFSNRYFFTGGTPADAAHWTTLSDAVVTAEKAIFSSATQIVQALGYAAGSEVPVHTKTYSTAGTLATSPAPAAPGDAAALVRYATSARSAKNHPIYLFNYYHGVYASSTVGGDGLLATQQTAMATYGALWISGISDGTFSAKRTGPYGHDALGVIVNSWLRHRDFR